MSDATHKKILAGLSGAALAAAYNQVPGIAQVARFSDLGTARLRVDRALVAADLKLTMAPGEPGWVVVPATAQKVTQQMIQRRFKYITVLVSENPKRRGSITRTRFEKYRTGMTTAEYRALVPELTYKKAMGDIYWDVAHGHISLSDEPPAS